MCDDQLLDRIERETVIQAPETRVWELVTEPGWWINDGGITPHRIEPTGTNRVIVHDSAYGRFAVEKVDERPREYVAFRWYSGISASRRVGELSAATSTLVEFSLIIVGPSTTKLFVVESGFAQLDEDARHRRQMVEDNAEGWGIELAALQQHAEGADR